MKTRFLALGVALTITSLARASDYTPIAIDPSSFNQDPVIEASAPKSIAEPNIVTHTTDGGTNKTGNTWYEVGYMTNSTGLPVHNSTFTTNNHTFQMAPDYHTNCVFFVGHQQSSWTPILDPATATLTTPAQFDHLSVLNASGNGPCRIGYTLHYQGGGTEVGLIPITSYDWFDNTAAGHAVKAYDAFGRVGMNGVIANNGTNAGEIFYGDIAVGDPGTPITSIDFFWWGNGTAQNPWSNGRSFIFGVSGSTDGGTTYSPIAVSGYNADGIVEADAAPKAVGAGFGSVLTNDNTYCTMTMDGGTSKRNLTWMERGYYTPDPNAGLPVAGSTITSATQPSIHYTMPSTYVGNCAVCLASNFPTANIKFQTPGAYGGLSFLLGDGNGAINVIAVIQFADGSTETNVLSAVDWFNRTDPDAYVCFGQINPGGRGVANIPDQFPNYFAPVFGQYPIRDPRNGGAAFPNVPNIRLFDALLPVNNSSGQITNVALSITNAGLFTTTVAIFAVSGNGGSAPSITQPAGLVRDSATGFTNATTGIAQLNNIIITKGWQGTNDIFLYVSNRLGNAVNYQWKRAPRGGGWRDLNLGSLSSFNLSTFANVAGPNIAGATSNILTISNATLADSADYIVVASNPYGSFTSYVATVMVLTTNYSVLLGAANGDTISKYTGDSDSATAAENFNAASDQVAQKWLSRGTGATNNFGGIAAGIGNLPFIGPAGYVVTPVSGASFVNSIRFFCANDSAGRDPRDYTLEGSNDGGSSWTLISGGPLLGTLMLPTARGGTGSAALNALANPCLEVDFANANSYKSYRVTITNNIEPYQTPLMQIAEIQLLGSFVPAPPTWARQPDPSTIAYVGASPTFAAKATGLGSLAPKYQWFKSPSTAISGATSSLLTLPNVQLSDSGSSYYCVATNSFGQITSSSGTLTVIAAPTQPYPAAVLANSPKAYIRLNEPDNGLGNNGVVAHDYVGGHNGYYSNTVNGVSGYNPVADPDTAMQVGTANDQLVEGINDVDFGRSANSPGATFTVEAWAFGGNQTVDSAIVAKGYSGILNPGIGTGAEQYAIDVSGGNPRKFRFLVRGADGQGYVAQSQVNPYDSSTLQPTWHHLVGICDQPNGKVSIYVDGLLAGGGTIPATAGIIAQALPTTIGARASSSIAEFDQQWVGSVDDVAIYGTALSPSQVLAHYFAGQRPPIITLQPTNQTTPENVIVTFNTSAYGAGTLTYQWYLSDAFGNTISPVAGQTSPNLSFNTSASQSGNFYQLVVNNPYGATTSSVAQLTVVGGVPTYFTDLPSSQTVFLGHVIQLRVVPGGTAPFTYQWKKNGVDIVDDYRTSGSHTNVLIIGYATNTDSGNYQVIVSNGQGSTPSVSCALLVTNVTSSAAPFTAAGTGWSLQGTTPPIMGANRLELTSSLGSTARAAFLTDKQNIGNFNASFVYTLAANANAGADGVTFCIQNGSAGAGALGAGGGSLAYAGGTPAVSPSAALAMNIYDPNTRGIQLLTGGTVPAAGAGAYAPILPVQLGIVANPIQVNVSYAGGIFTASFRDTVANTTFTTNYVIDLPTVVGDNSAYVGFTGADGGVSSTQVISNFVMTPPAVTLKAQRVGNTLVLNWPASSGAFLRSTPSLLNPVWAYDTSSFLVVSNQAQVTVTPLSGNKFFRLDVYP